MPLTQLAPPYPIFTDKNGDPLDAGYLYFGVVNLNPETNPIQVYWDNALTQPAAQPLRTSNGYVMRNGSPALIYAGSQFSVTVRDKKGALVIYSPVGYGIIPGTSATSTDQMTYNEGSVGAVDRVLTSRLQDFVSVKDFGAVGDGVTDDTAAIQAALDTGKSVFVPDGVFFFSSPISFTANGQSLFGNGNNSALKHRGTLSAGPSWISVNAKDDVSVVNLQIDGGTGATAANPGIWVDGGSKNFTADGCLFKGGNQVVYLSTCSNVKVVNNTFDSTYYGVIQRFGYASSHVLIDGNTCVNSFRDFVEANCAAAAPSENWIVSNNTFDTNQQFPTPITEGRFVGITSVRGAVITGNTVKKIAGDAAVHLEDTLGETIISNNVFDNCLTSGGNLGYIFLLNSAENSVITGNIFLRTDTSLPAAYAVAADSNSYANALVIADNLVRGEGASANMSGFNLGFQNASSALTCTGNVFQDVNEGLSLNNTNNAVIANNAFNRCQTPIFNAAATTLVGSAINGNNFIATVGTHDILLAASNRVDVQNNRFSKAVSLGSVTDVFVNDNSFGSGASLVKPVGTRAYAAVNAFQSTGLLQAKYPNLGTALSLSASKSATNIGGSAAVSFRVSCAADSGAWVPGTITIKAASVDGTGATHTSAWWEYRFRVLGGSTSTNQAVEDSGGSVASYSITFTNVSTSTTEVVFDVLVTATGADRCIAELSCVGFFGVNSIV